MSRNKRSDWLTGLLDCEKMIFEIGVPATLDYFHNEISWAYIYDHKQCQDGWADALHHHKLYIKGEMI